VLEEEEDLGLLGRQGRLVLYTVEGLEEDARVFLPRGYFVYKALFGCQV
jgi:hypothetical protein